MSFSVIIPARFASTRLPGKPLLDIGGKPMLQRVYEQAAMSAAERVVIAADDRRVLEAAEGFGATALLTDPQHPSGTDRLAEASRLLDLPEDAVLVNVQGDEPLLPPALIDQVAANLAACPGADMATLCEAIESAAELFDPNAVKVVMSDRGHALYFSRAPIPWVRDAFPRNSRGPFPQAQGNPETGADEASGGASHPRHSRASGNPESFTAAEASRSGVPVNAWRHIGIYAFRVGFLREYAAWPPSPLETAECLEQLRALSHGRTIHVAPACEPVPPGVDTPEDLARVRGIIERGEDGETQRR